MNILRSVFILASLPTLAHCADKQAAFTHALQVALDQGDTPAVAKPADLTHAPASLRFLLLDNARECGSVAACTVSLAPIDAARQSQIAEAAAKGGMTAPAVVGMVVVEMKRKDGTGSDTMRLPYGEYGGTYKLATLHYTPEQLAAQRARTNEQLVEELFERGIYDMQSGEKRTDWAKAASRLSAGGGGPGAALVEQIRALAAAVDANDPDAAAHAGDRFVAQILADTRPNGEPVPLAERQALFATHALRFLRDVVVKEGWQLGNNAVLVIEAKDGIGWTVRGPVVLNRMDDAWIRSSENTVEYPAQ